MPVLGLVVVLEDARAETRADVAARLAARAELSGLSLGEAAAHRWPAVLEGGSAREIESRVELLRTLPGVAGVDVVYADFEDLLARPPAAVSSELHGEG